MAFLDGLFALTSVAGLVIPEVKEAIRKPKLRKINAQIRANESNKIGDYNAHRNVRVHDDKLDRNIMKLERRKEYV